MNPLTALITGLSTGGLTCLAVQGGLLLGLLARRQTEELAGSFWSRLLLPVSAFLIAKIAAYTLLGLGLGAIGSKLQLTTGASVWLQSIAGVFIVITGLRLIWPQWLPWLTIQPPAAVRRFIRRQGKSDSWLAPAFLGLLTIVIPCGTTIAMETAAVATGQALAGAAILFAFTLGTAPLFLAVGVLAKGTAVMQKQLAAVTAAVVIALGVYTLNGVLIMVDSPYSIQREVAAFRWALTGGTETATAASASVSIDVFPNGYAPNELTVPAGERVAVSLNAKGRLGCTSIFRIPKLDVEQQLAPNETTTIAVIFPQPGRYTFSCGMGMYSGTIDAV